MGLLDGLASWFRRESADVSKAVRDLERRLDADLGQKERHLSASAEERLDVIQEEIDQDGDALRDIRRRIEATAAGAELEPEEAVEPGDDRSAS